MKESNICVMGSNQQCSLEKNVRYQTRGGLES